MALERITSADDPRLAPYRALPAHDAERRDGLFVAETREVVRQLIRGARFRLHSVLLTEPARAALADCLADLAGGALYLAPRDVLKAVVGFDFHRGCLALAERGAEPSLAELLARAPRRLVLLEAVSNPDNVGGVLRAAQALGADAVVLSPGCCDPLYRKAVRVSVGAALTLPWARAADWPAALGEVRAAGATLVALAPDGDTDVAALDGLAPGRAALVVGAEGAGLRPATVAAADLVVRIPIVPGVDSLNLVTACAVALDRLGGARRVIAP
jgi:tRNA G18 (ribose-2'-O)-methylase SpoU